MSFLALTLVSAGAVAVLQAVTFGVALRLGRHSVVDVSWGLGFVLVGLVSLGLGDGPLARRLLVAVLVAVWGLRLAGHIARRQRGAAEDPRYADLLARAKGNPNAYAARMIYLLQGVMIWFISLPVQVSAVAPGRGLVALAGLGAAVWLVGVVFEAVGDAQLAAFKADPASQGTVLDTGLWRYTRHPNYFGDACVWWGLYLVAASAWPGVLTLLSPAVMTLFLTRGTGQRMTEARMSGRPGFAEYVARTSGFVPRPPRKAGPTAG